MSTPEIPAEVVEAAARAFYETPDDVDVRKLGLLAMLVDYIGKEQLRRMLAVAFAAGRESAYTRDEWRVVAGPNEFPVVFQDEICSEEHLAIVLRDARNRWRGEVIWVQHCRNGATEWSRVDD